MHNLPYQPCITYHINNVCISLKIMLQGIDGLYSAAVRNICYKIKFIKTESHLELVIYLRKRREMKTKQMIIRKVMLKRALSEAIKWYSTEATNQNAQTVSSL